MIEVVGLRFEYLAEAMGVDTPEPRLSWRIVGDEARRGLAQRAYEVRVERVVGEKRIGLWDSGKVASDQSVNVVYGGTKLESGWECRWRVRVWDEQGAVSAWSEEGRFVMGLLEPGDWRGEWICCGEAEDHKHIWYRKVVELDAKPRQAIGYVCSIGYHELYVNGQRIGGAVLTPGVTNLARRALYMTYDIAGALVSGRNVIGLWTGPGWARADGSYGKGVWKQSPMFRAQVHVDGSPVVVSDGSWRCKVSCSENIGLWKGGGEGTYGGERIDGRLEEADWNSVELDDSNWASAAVGSQSVELSSAVFEPDRRVQTLRPVAIEKRDGAWRVDFGRNFTGWFEVDLRGGREGEVVKIHTANRLEETLEYDQESEFIFGASGTGRFCHRFNWMAGRWVTLHGLSVEPRVEDIRGYIVSNDRQRYGQFECSNGLLNAIYETDLRTYQANTVNGAVMDCPHRERYGYGEVALACTWGCAIPNFESAAMYTKVSRDWCDVQSDDGMVNTIAPQPYSGAGGTLWSSAPITLTWECYRAYGDRRLLARAYPVFKRWLDYLNRAVTADGVLMPYARVSRFLGDWATPHGNEYGDLPEAQLFNNCVYAYDLMVSVQAATILGHDEDAQLYQQRLDQLRKSVHEHFYRPDTGRYGDGRQMAMLFPLYVRVTPESLRQKVRDGFLADLNEKGYMDTGSPGLPILFKCVVEDWAEPEVLYAAMTRTAYPSYGFFLARQESTWPEYWEVDGIASRIHTCYTSVAGYFMKGLGGIGPHPDVAGMQHVVIRPWLATALAYSRARTASLYGVIESNMKRVGGQLVLEVVIPGNSCATVHLRGATTKSVSESGKPVAEVASVKVIGEQDGSLVVQVESGRYVFDWPEPATS